MRTLDKQGAALPDSRASFEAGKLEEAGLKVTERRYEPSETIFLSGDPANRLYLLVEGVVRVRKPYGDYSQATVALLKDRGGFGEFDLFGVGGQTSSAEAMTACRVASVRKGDLRYAMQRRPGIAVELFSLFSEKLRHSEQTMEVLLHREISSRLLALLPRLAERFAGHSEYGAEPLAEAVIPLRHSELAGMIASTREAVSKTLGQLQREGLVELEPRKIKIKDPRFLEEQASKSMCRSAE